MCTDCFLCRAVRRQLDMPVLVLHGDSDVALGVELLDGIEAVAPNSTVKVLKNCSHWWVHGGGVPLVLFSVV
jgi:pimeloyl-ACP methyl ester carboxylesterase